MGTPATRTPIKIARGTYSNLNTNKSDIVEGEICYATDQNKLYVKEGSNLEDTQASSTLTTQGDILYRDGSGEARLAKGTAGQVLKMNSGATAPEWGADTNTNTTYTISCVDGDNSDEEKIRLTDSGSGTDDVVLEAGTGLSIARSGDKITFTNTVSDTNTTYSAGTGLALSSTTFSLDLDTTNEWTKPQTGNVVVATHSSGATYDFDLDTSNNFKVTLSATAELGFSNLDASREGQTGIIQLINGDFIPTWGNEVQFEGGSSGTISLTKSATSILAYYVLQGGTKVLVTAVLDVKDD